MTEAAARGLSYGAATEIEVEMARMVCGMVPGVEMVRMVNSGTEAVMSAIRAARGYTGRDKIVKFNGCYHGHSDCLLVQAGSGVMTAGLPGSAGVPAGSTADTLTAEYNDLGERGDPLPGQPRSNCLRGGGAGGSQHGRGASGAGLFAGPAAALR